MRLLYRRLIRGSLLFLIVWPIPRLRIKDTAVGLIENILPLLMPGACKKESPMLRFTFVFPIKRRCNGCTHAQNTVALNKKKAPFGAKLSMDLKQFSNHAILWSPLMHHKHQQTYVHKR